MSTKGNDLVAVEAGTFIVSEYCVLDNNSKQL